MSLLEKQNCVVICVWYIWKLRVIINSRLVEIKEKFTEIVNHVNMNIIAKLHVWEF